MKQEIADKVVVFGRNQRIAGLFGRQSAWLFDFRNIFLEPEILESIADLFFERMAAENIEVPYQVGGVETASIPLVAGIVIGAKKRSLDINGFFVRKSRKKSGLLKMIEGQFRERDVVLVDDLMNTGQSLIRQVEIMEGLGRRVRAVFVILRFRDEAYYRYFHERGIRIINLFTLDDFGLQLGGDEAQETNRMPFRKEWVFRSPDPDLFIVAPKSAPAIDDLRLYFGTDSGRFWALDKKSGETIWEYRIGLRKRGNAILSSPARIGDLVCFGADDGNIYALDAETGKRRWVFMEADRVAASPCAVPAERMLLAGIGTGIWSKQGSAIALDARTGKKLWEYRTPAPLHASPKHSAKHGLAVFGSEDGSVYVLDARTGALRWKFVSGGAIKGSFALDEKRGLVVFGSYDGFVYALDIGSGRERWRFRTEAGIHSDPLIEEDTVIAASLDKRLYGISLDDGARRWMFDARSRIFASPIFADGKIYVGCNNGRFHEVDPATGRETGFFQTTERITTRAIYDPATGRFYISTFANEVYCLYQDDSED